MQEKHFLSLKGISALAICALSLTTVAGCADRNKNGQPDSAATSSEIDKSLGNADEAAANAVSKADDVASNAVDAAGNAMKNLDDAAVVTPKIKAAYAANPSLKAMSINVDTTDQNVTLSGNVKNAAQKSLAETIAKKNAPGYKIINNLKVAGGASPKMNR